MKGYKDLVELLKTVQARAGHPLDGNMEAICDYQDMIAHSDEDQLEELANGVYKETFYRVYDMAYGTIETIKFHCKHGKKIIEMLEENCNLKCDLETAQDQIKKEQKKAEQAFSTSCKFQESYADTLKQKEDLEKKLDAAQDEIIRLKAKLFDLMEK